MWSSRLYYRLMTNSCIQCNLFAYKTCKIIYACEEAKSERKSWSTHFWLSVDISVEKSFWANLKFFKIFITLKKGHVHLLFPLLQVVKNKPLDKVLALFKFLIELNAMKVIVSTALFHHTKLLIELREKHNIDSETVKMRILVAVFQNFLSYFSFFKKRFQSKNMTWNFSEYSHFERKNNGSFQ